MSPTSTTTPETALGPGRLRDGDSPARVKLGVMGDNRNGLCRTRAIDHLDRSRRPKSAARHDVILPVARIKTSDEQPQTRR